MLQKLNFNLEENKFVLEGSAKIVKQDGFTMLVTVPEHDFWKNIYPDGNVKPSRVFVFKELEPGVYLTGHNFHSKIGQYTDLETVEPWERLGKDGVPKKMVDHISATYFEDTVESYGVADNLEQIKERYKEQIDSASPIVIAMVEICKEDQPEKGGWRWNKWGEYIGSKNPQCEYLADEPDIDSVYAFHVYSVKPKAELVLNESPSKKNKM